MHGTATEPTQITFDAHATLHEGMGPMFLRETLASAEHGDYELEWTRIVPMGLHLAVRKNGETVRVVVLAERKLMEAMATAALASLEAGA